MSVLGSRDLRRARSQGQLAINCLGLLQLDAVIVAFQFARLKTASAAGASTTTAT
jgi:hypothetical protein